MAKKSIAKKRKKHNRKRWADLPPVFFAMIVHKVF